MSKSAKILKAAMAVIALAYAFALLKIVMFKSGLSFSRAPVQYMPFGFVSDIASGNFSADVLLKNVLGNFAIFIPLGVLAPIFFGRLTFLKTLLAGFLLSLAFEIIQFFTGLGIADVDDLLLNTLGTAAGAGLFFGVFRRVKTAERANMAAFAFLCVFGACGLLALWLYHPSMLPTPIVHENEVALGGVERDSYDFSGVCLSAEDGKMTLREDVSRAFAEDAPIIAEHIDDVLSPNGNVQKVIVTYELSDVSALSDRVSGSDGVFVDVWLNEAGECKMLIYTVYE